MNGIYIEIISLLIIDIIIVFISIMTNGMLSRVYDDNQDLRHYVKELEEELNKMYDKFDDNHRMTNTMYNEHMNNKENWKNIREYMEEKDGLYYEERS